MIKLKIIVVVLIFLPLAGWAQCDQKIAGTVKDSETNELLEFATITIVENQKQAFTKSDGTFQFENLCPGSYTLVCRHIGCSDTTFIVNTSTGTGLQITMPHSMQNIHSVEVVGEKGQKEVCINPIIISNNNVLTHVGNNLGEILKAAPGVTALQTGPTVAKPMINGLTGNRVIIINNGVRLEGQQWGSEHAPEVDPSQAYMIDVHTGSSSLEYGSDAIGGAVIINPAPLPYHKKFGGVAQMAYAANNRMGTATGMLQGGVGKSHWAWRTQGTYRRGADVFTPNYGLDNTALSENNFSAALGFDKGNLLLEGFYSRFNTKIGIFKGSHIGNVTDLLQAINNPTPFFTTDEYSYTISRPYQHVVHHTGKLNMRLKLDEKNMLFAVYAVQNNRRSEFDKDKPLNDSIAALDLPEFLFDLTTHALDVTYKYYGEKLRLTAGISGQFQSNRWEGRYFIPNFRGINSGAFAIASYDLGKFNFQAGLRYDVKFLKVFRYFNNVLISPEYTFKNPAFNAGISYKLISNLSVSAHGGLSWRPPAINELYSNGLHHGAAAYEIGDTTFTAEKAYTVAGTVRYSKSDKAYVFFRVNQSYFTNFINLQPVLPPTLTIAGAFPTFRYTQVPASYTAILFSGDVNIIEQLKVVGTATMLWARNRSTKQYLLGAPPHRFTLGVKYQLKDKRWFEKPFAQVSGTYVMKQYLVDQTADYLPPPPAYFLLNVEAGFTAHIRNTHFGVAVVCSNLLNTVYRDYTDRFRYYNDAIGRNISIKLNIPFGANEYY